MSFEINWAQLCQDEEVNELIKEFIDRQLQGLELPPYIDNVKVTDFSLGTKPPAITIRHIGDPFNEFYETNDGENNEKWGAAFMRPNLSRRHNGEESDSEEEKPEMMSHEVSISEDMPLNGESGYDNNRRANPFISLKRSTTSPESIMPKIQSESRTYVHNYNVNNVGLGNLNNASTHTRTDSPANILHANPYTGLKLNQKIYSRLELEKAFFSGNRISPNEMELEKPSKEENDIQIVAEVQYNGDMYIGISVNLLVNYPSSNFILLPIKLKVTDLDIHSILSIAYLKKSVFLSFLCDIDDNNFDYFSSDPHLSNRNRAQSSVGASGGNFVDYVPRAANRERIDIIKNIKIDSEIGDEERNVLRNVGKVERFLAEKIRDIIRDELAWPSWICLNLSEDESDDGI